MREGIMLDPFVVKGAYPEIENHEQLNPDKAALIALVMQNFLEIMYDEIKRSGFSNLEFLEKCELFLRSVTSEYDKDNFATLLHVFEQIDPEFERSKFYYGFTSMRSICTQDLVLASEITDRLHISRVPEPINLSNLLLFANHLVLNMIDFVQQVRKIPSISNMTIDELRCYLSGNYQNCVYDALNQLYLAGNLT